ncbi:MAG: hypothetical protein AABY32_04425 [Nanoarchaeota archaeon]
MEKSSWVKDILEVLAAGPLTVGKNPYRMRPHIRLTPKVEQQTPEQIQDDAIRSDPGLLEAINEFVRAENSKKDASAEFMKLNKAISDLKKSRTGQGDPSKTDEVGKKIHEQIDRTVEDLVKQVRILVRNEEAGKLGIAPEKILTPKEKEDEERLKKTKEEYERRKEWLKHRRSNTERFIIVSKTVKK